MAHMKTLIGRLVLRDDGQDLVEYGILMALIAVAAIVGITTLGTTITTVFWSGIGQAI